DELLGKLALDAGLVDEVREGAAVDAVHAVHFVEDPPPDGVRAGLKPAGVIGIERGGAGELVTAVLRRVELDHGGPAIGIGRTVFVFRPTVGIVAVFEARGGEAAAVGTAGGDVPVHGLACK